MNMHKNVKDLTGQRFGRLTVLKDSQRRQNGSVIWECLCDCGNIHYVATGNLRQGQIKSCGCLRKEMMSKNLAGQKFGKLTALYPLSERNEYGGVFWHCKCDCGKEVDVVAHTLLRGYKKSCGCLRSVGEETIVELLNSNNISYVREKTFDTCILPTGGKGRFDFYVNNKYLIEFDGPQHFMTKQDGWFTPEKLKKTQESDRVKNNWCKENQIPLIRIPYYKQSTLTIQDLLLETSEYVLS